MQNERVGDWIQTYTGKQFWPIDPRACEITIEDIAHALSLQCRFSGHCREFYSVAQHSCLVSSYCIDEDAGWGLLHDAAEAYLVDLPRPIKRFSSLGVEYRKAEERVMAAVCERFGIPPKEPKGVKVADDYILRWEQRDLMPASEVAWNISGSMGLPVHILRPMPPEKAERNFLDLFAELFRT